MIMVSIPRLKYQPTHHLPRHGGPDREQLVQPVVYH